MRVGARTEEQSHAGQVRQRQAPMSDREGSGRRLELPEAAYIVQVQRLIVALQRQVLDSRLRDMEAIERVAVEERQSW